MTRTIAALCVALAFAACSDGGSTGAVSMTSAQRFDPEEITVTAGAIVTWTNTSAQAHTVTAYENDLPDGADYFASGGGASEEEARSSLADGLLTQGESFEVTFAEPGTYRYFCIPHEEQGMVGTIVVEE